MNISRFYILALLIIATLLLASYGLMGHAISSQAYDATIINISGRQRMLSQRMALLTAQLIYPEKRESAFAGLSEAVTEMKHAHLGLTQGSALMNLPGIRSETIRSLYFDERIPHTHGRRIVSLDHLVRHYIEEVEEVLALPYEEMTPDSRLLSHTINDYHDIILPYLHEVVNQYEYESLQRVKRLQDIELIVLAIILAVLILEGLFIFRPMTQKVRERTVALLEANEKLNRSRQAEKFAALGKLSSGMAHEISNALQPALGLGEFVKKGLDESGNKKHLEYMDLILKSAHHANGIIENVLSFTHEKDVIVEKYPAFEVLEETLRFCLGIMPSTVIFDVSVNKAEEDDAFLFACNKTELVQIFLNLLKNAVTAMDEKGTVSIALSRGTMPENAEASVVMVRIVDAGHGMDEETVKRIFDPFFTTKDISEGTGLGLSAVHGMVEQYGGYIDVESTPGEGSAFTLYFPVTQEKDMADGDE